MGGLAPAIASLLPTGAAPQAPEPVTTLRELVYLGYKKGRWIHVSAVVNYISSQKGLGSARAGTMRERQTQGGEEGHSSFRSILASLPFQPFL